MREEEIILPPVKVTERARVMRREGERLEIALARENCYTRDNRRWKCYRVDRGERRFARAEMVCC